MGPKCTFSVEFASCHVNGTGDQNSEVVYVTRNGERRDKTKSEMAVGCREGRSLNLLLLPFVVFVCESGANVPAGQCIAP